MAEKRGQEYMLVRQPAEAWVHVTVEELATFQKRHGLTLTALARHLGAKTTSLSAWLAREKIPSLVLQERMKAALALAPGEDPSSPHEPEPAEPTPLNAWLQRLKDYRDRTGLTQTDLGRRLDMSKTTISQWFTGAREPSPSALKKVRALLRAADAPSPDAAPDPSPPATRVEGLDEVDPNAAARPPSRDAALKHKLLDLLQASITTSRAQVRPEELPQLIRDMRAALE